MESKCKLCGQPIWVGEYAYGGAIVILDGNPSPDGEFVLVGEPSQAMRLNNHPTAAMLDLPLHKQHVETCRVWNKGKAK